MREDSIWHYIPVYEEWPGAACTVTINPTFGADPLMKSLIVVILGGVARFTSPIYAAFVVGIAESFSAYFLGLYWSPALLFAMMIGVLLIKPEGLFGHRSKTL